MHGCARRQQIKGTGQTVPTARNSKDIHTFLLQAVDVFPHRGAANAGLFGKILAGMETAVCQDSQQARADITAHSEQPLKRL
ncbi:MAG: hypothetical protein U5P41_05085 [Gammaproteobacteria bacterium]|nr:hypothetical protein [Gammaproteobacteria bacterium]